ncbi:aminoglycoside phosphotransferase family protein [Jiangella anatolica]|uniref:Acetyltransferase n=1 Tax=Jiangella anatolica TaxID=2670374 RepID=A0A2W2B090_9ACTN|nr:aminoglycoside phosphotransferase family protein [Jiangella anatolica]PZF80821.1 acetyltransferase [Jiangella anatolica]
MTHIDAALVAGLIADQFPQWAGLPVRPVELQGVDNRTFRLGDELSVRLPSAAHYREQVAKEQRWLPLLAPRLPVPIPAPVAVGRPGRGYPWTWSVNRWLAGTTALSSGGFDDVGFARDVAGFLRAPQAADASGGPGPGTHNFQRGGPVSFYGDETARALDTLAGRLDVAAARKVWDAALAATFIGPPVWLHGDVAPGNLLVRDGRLSAVIDFGTCGVGDPACDLVLAWTFLSRDGRSAFRASLDGLADEAMWARARGWALWKALITYDSDVPRVRAEARRVTSAVLAEA